MHTLLDDFLRYQFIPFPNYSKRKSPEGNEYKYERVCLLIVDFREETPKLYSTIDELKSDGLVNENTDVNLDDLTIENFASDLLRIYSDRFNTNLLK